MKTYQCAGTGVHPVIGTRYHSAGRSGLAMLTLFESLLCTPLKKHPKKEVMVMNFQLILHDDNEYMSDLCA